MAYRGCKYYHHGCELGGPCDGECSFYQEEVEEEIVSSPVDLSFLDYEETTDDALYSIFVSASEILTGRNKSEPFGVCELMVEYKEKGLLPEIFDFLVSEAQRAIATKDKNLALDIFETYTWHYDFPGSISLKRLLKWDD